MTPAELSDIFRLEVDDLGDPPMWTTEELDSYMDQAQRAFARRTDCFLDSSSPVTRLAVTANNALVTLSPLVTRIRRAELASTSRIVVVSTVAEMDEGQIVGRDYGLRVPYQWRTATGEPQFILTDFAPGKVLMVPKPSANAVANTMNLIVYRLPLAKVTSESVAFEILDEDHQYGLRLYMQKLAYLKQDTETYNPKRSAAAGEQWGEFIVTAKQDFRRRRFVHKAVAYGGL